MTSAAWLTIPPTEVPIDGLTATQSGVYFHALITPPIPVGGDLLPHVIAWQGCLYLEDGHHRVTRALMQGHRNILARIHPV